MGALERYNEKKKKQGNTPVSSSGALQRYEMNKKYSGVNTSNVTDEYINKFLTDAGDFISNTKAEENGYNTWKDLSSRSDTIKAWAWQNRENLTEESYKDLNDRLSTFDSAGEFWNSFTSPEEYDMFLKLSPNQEKYSADTQSAYSTAKGALTDKNTFTSDLTDEQREKRIKEIKSELTNARKIVNGLMYGSVAGNVNDAVKKKNDEIAALEAELTELERIGTFSSSEMLQWEIEDAKKELAIAQSKANEISKRFGRSGVDPADAEAYRAAQSEVYAAQQKIDYLERQQEQYADISKYGDVVKKDDNEGLWSGFKNFGAQFSANYRVNELSREADKAMNTYLDNPTEENKQIAYAYAELAKQYATNNEKALDDEGQVLPWLSQSAAGYLPQLRDQIIPEAIGGGVGALVGASVGVPKEGASIGAGIASGLANYGVMRGSVYRTLVEAGIDEEIAREAANDEALLSSLIEGGETALSWLLMGSTKALGAIGNAATASVAKGSTNAAVKLIANLASKSASKAVTNAAASASAPLWKTALKTVGGVVGNAASEYGEEWIQQAVSIANKDRALQGNTGGLVSETGKVAWDAVTGKNPEAWDEMHEAGKEGFKIGLMFGGTSTVANNVVTHYFNAKTDKMKNDIADAVIEDAEALSVLIDEGKASGGVSAKIAKEVETANENGKVTRSQVKRLIESNEVYIKHEEQSQAEPDTLEKAAMDVVNERNGTQTKPITFTEAQKVTGWGNYGSELVTSLANSEGTTLDQAKKTVETAYLAGFTGMDKAKASFVTEMQERAFDAGKRDGIMQNTAAKEKAKTATVYGKNSGVIKNEYYEKLSPAEQEMFSVFAEDFGESAEMVNEIVAAVIKGKKYTASAEHSDGRIRGSASTGKPVHQWILHENGHRMEQFATDEWNALSNALYARAEQFDRQIGREVSEGLAFDRIKDKHEKAGQNLSTRGYVGEVVMRELETIFSSAEEFNAWRAELDAKPQVKTAWAKFMDWLTEILEKIKSIVANRKLSPEARAAAKAEIAEIEHIKELYADAYKATRTAVAERTAAMESAKTEQIDTTTEPDTLEKAARDVVDKRNAAERAKKAPVTSENKASEQTPAPEVKEPKQPSNEAVETKTASIKPTPETEFDNVLKLGTGFVDGKQRVAEFYSTNPSKAEAVEFLKKEYGQGGRSITLADGTRGYTLHDAKELKIDNYKGDVRVFSWSEVDDHLRKLIENGEYSADTKKAANNTAVGETKEIEYKHLYNEQTVSKEFLDSVNPEIEKAIYDIRNDNSENVPSTIEVAKLSDEAVKNISAFVGFDVSGYACKIEKDALQHIENRHGINGEHDQSMSDPKDTARMGYVINNSDHMEWVTDENGNITRSRKYNNKDNSLCPVMLVSVKIDGTYCISQVIPDTKRKTIWVSSARIEKADGGNQVPNGNNVTPQRTSETPLDSSSATEILPQKTENVKIQTLKHSKSVYPLFKGEARVVVGEDMILSGNVGIPLTDDALAEVKKVVEERNIEMGGSASFAKIGIKDNDVIISGDPKVAETVIRGKRASVYVFKVGNEYYICEQKYLDAFNNGENTIRANNDKRKPWAVYGEDGNIVGAFVPAANVSMTDAEYNSLQSVNDVLEANKAKKAAQKNAPFNATETNLLCSSPKLMTSEVDGNSYITDGKVVIKADSSAIEYIKGEYKAKSNNEVSSVDGARIEALVKNDVLGEVSKTVEDNITETDKNGKVKVKDRRTACVVGDMVFLYDTRYVDMLSKRSSTLKILSGGILPSTVLAGYDSNGDLVGFAMPIRPIDGSYVEVDGKQIPYTVNIKKESSATEEKAPAKTTKAKPKESKPKVVETTAKIDDFGEKIGGARKDQWNTRGLVVDDLDGMNDREREKNVKKDNVWKRPNYRALVEAGGDRGLLWAVNEIRKSLQQNIFYGYNVTAEVKAEKQKLFIETVRAIQEMAENAKTQADFEAMGEKWMLDNGYLQETGNIYKKYVYTPKFSQNPALYGTNYLNNIRYLAKNFDKLTELADRNQFAVDAKSVVPKGFSIVGGEGSVGGKYVRGEWGSDGKWVEDTSYAVAKGSYIIKDGFATKEAALEWLKQGLAKKKGKTRFVPEQLLEVHRKGPDYRNSKHIDGQNYIDTFGFKGGEFGNWMSAKDRQVSLDYGFDALKDLADALGVADTDISFGGNLNIAFGARGQGLSGAAAHYENERRVINLTKMNGAGSLAHEWFHALDDFIGGYTNNFATDRYHTLPERTKQAIRDLITTMQYKDATQEETDLSKQKMYEQSVRGITNTIEGEFRWVKAVENGTFKEEDAKYYKRTPTIEDAKKYRELFDKLIETGEYKYVERLSELRKEVNGRVIPKEVRDSFSWRLVALNSGKSAPIQRARKMTDFYEGSRTFGKLHAKDGDYWDSTVEMSARAFACYVADKTNKQNDYLSAHSDSAVTLDADRDGNPVVVRAYPVGEERTAINNAFDNLIEALKADGFLHESVQTEKPADVSYSLEDEGEFSNNLEIKTKKGYTGNTKSSRKTEWHTDLTKTQMKQVLIWLDVAGTPEANRITGTAYWYNGRLDGEDLLVIYSAEDPAGKTILYEVKGENAKLELDILTDLLEGEENGESINGESSFAQRVSEGNWLLYGNRSQSDLRHLGRGEYNQNAGILPKQPQRNGSRAFRNVIENLFAEQRRIGRQYSLDDLDEAPSKQRKAFLDAIEDLRNGKRNAADKLVKYVDSGTISTKDYDSLIERYGAIPEGEKPHREVQVPQKTAKDKKVSQTVRTILEAKATPDAAIPTIEKMVEDGVFSYDVYTDKQAIKDAEDYIKEYGWDESLKDWLDSVNKGEVSKQITAMGWALYNNAANTAATATDQTTRDVAVRTSLEILNAMVQHQRSAAQALQATRILKKLAPETQLYGIQKSVSALQKQLTDKYGKNAPNLKIDEKLAEDFLNAKTQEERDAAAEKIYEDIGRQTPSDWLDKWNEWRYFAMLGNPRTHIKNIVGNAFFAPVVLAKDLTATAIESIVHRVSHGKTLRGKALVLGNKSDRALLKAAWDDYAKVADKITDGGKYNDSALANRSIEKGKRVFGNKYLDGAVKFVSAALEVEDMWFSQPHYAYAMAQYCKANNITPEQIARGKAIAPARDYAVKEAQKATYRDTNAFSQMVSEWGRNGRGKKSLPKKVMSTVIEGVLPFRKTPANILVRGVEYSPIGLIKGLTYDLYQVSKGKMTSTEAIDHISAGLTGTGLLSLGVLLAAQGLVRGHGEDDKEEKEFKETMGHQAYSLELPNGQSITLDWLAPEALPFFVGVNLWETTRGSNEDVNFSTILRAVSNVSEPMLEMSCLQGLNDLFESVGYASSNDTSGIVSILASAVTSHLTQAIPTILGQMERTGEANRMTTYTEKNAFLTGDMQYILGKISSKIPFWDYQQIPYIDAWGRKEASGTALKRGFNNFLNPAYTSTIDESEMEKELLRLFEQTGENSVFPERADKYFTVDGERKDLTADEYVKYATLKGEKSYEAITKLVQSKEYKDLSDSEKVKAIEEAYTYADQKAKSAVSNYKPESWVSKADKLGTNVEDFFTFRANVSAAGEDGSTTKSEVVDIISGMNIDNDDVWALYLSKYDSAGDHYAHDNGIAGKTYLNFLEALDEVDKPTESGKYGTYTQDEAYEAIKNLTGLSRQDKAILWQSVNKNWSSKNNPFR